MVISRRAPGAKGQVVSTFLVDFIVFVSSYFPLFLILLIKDIQSGDLILNLKKLDFSVAVYLSNPIWSLSFFAFSTSCLAFLLFLKWYLFSPKRIGRSVVIKQSELIRGDMLNYTIPFLVGLIGFSYKSWQEVGAFVVFMVFMFLFLRKVQGVMLNPMFLLLNIKMYKIRYSRVGSDREDTMEVLHIGALKAAPESVALKEVSGIGFILVENQFNRVEVADA